MTSLTPREILKAFDEGLEAASRSVKRKADGKNSTDRHIASQNLLRLWTSRILADTPVKTLRKTYGKDFAPGYRSDTKLQTLLEREGFETVDQYLVARSGAKQEKGRR